MNHQNKSTTHWDFSGPSPTLDGVPASLYFYDSVTSPSFIDTEEQKDNIHDSLLGSVLEQEGLSNDFSSLVNKTRREYGFHVIDNVVVYINCGQELGFAILWNLKRIARDTKAVHFVFNSREEERNWFSYECGDWLVKYPVKISLEVDSENNWVNKTE